MKRSIILGGRLLGVFSCLALLASDPPNGDWPMWGSTPDRNMISTMRDLPTS